MHYNWPKWRNSSTYRASVLYAAMEHFSSDVSILKWSFSGNAVATKDRLRDASAFPRRTDINLSKVPHCALCRPQLYVDRQPFVPTNRALTRLRCTRQHLRPEPPLTDKWQRRVSCCCARATQTHLTHSSSTQPHKGTSWQVQLTSPCFHQQLCPT